jgi:hypothetical protein
MHRSRVAVTILYIPLGEGRHVVVPEAHECSEQPELEMTIHLTSDNFGTCLM